MAPVYTAADLVEDPQVQALDMVTDRARRAPGTGADARDCCSACRTRPGAVRSTGASEIGADTDEVLVKELGIDPARDRGACEPVASAPESTTRQRRPPTRCSRLAVEGGLEVFDLGRPYTVGMPQSPNHPAYRHALDRRHGDTVRDCGGSAAADIITLGCHVGTHIDALAHVSQDGKLHGGIDADEAQRGGRFIDSGVHTIDPIAGRGVLLDVACGTRARFVRPRRPPARGPRDHRRRARSTPSTRQGTEIRPGDTVLIRSGWGMRFAEGEAYLGAGHRRARRVRRGRRVAGRPRPHRRGCRHDRLRDARRWRRARLACPPTGSCWWRPASRSSRRSISRAWPTAAVHDFLFVLSHLNLVGATGAPVRPLAIAGSPR